jgi:hypothetical protein
MIELTAPHPRVALLRFSGRISLEETQRFASELGSILHGRARSGVKTVCCGDFRDTSLFKPDVFEVFTALLRSDNPAVEAAGHCCRSPSLLLQLERMMREGAHPGRKVFAEPEQTLAYLAKFVDDEALRSMRKHLTEAH